MRIGRTVTGLVSGMLLSAPAPAQVQVDVNAALANSPGSYSIQSSASWYFTPSSTFFLLALKTRFNPSGPNADRTVTAEVWSDRPTVGGSLLASGNFQSNSALGVFGGGSFSPILLQAGVMYFFGFATFKG